MTFSHSYDWTCESQYKYGEGLLLEPPEPASCTLVRCGDLVLPAGKECCADQILDEDVPETCCTEADATNQDAIDHSNGTLI